MTPRPIASISPDTCRQLAAVFTDIDGTMTDDDGRIPAESLAALERIRAAGLRVLVVTGRPAGWCDLIARTWPVDGVVGENGGLAFRCDGHTMVRRHWQRILTELVRAARAADRREDALARCAACGRKAESKCSACKEVAFCNRACLSASSAFALPAFAVADSRSSFSFRIICRSWSSCSVSSESGTSATSDGAGAGFGLVGVGGATTFGALALRPARLAARSAALRARSSALAAARPDAPG